MRTLNGDATALLARLQAGERIPVVQLVEVLLDVPQRITNAGLPLAWGGYTWQPLGIAIEPIEDAAADFMAITLALPAVTDEQLALALVEPVEGATVRIYDALVDPATGVVADAVLAWSGTANVPGVQDGDEASIAIQCEHRGALALRPKPLRYTDEAQRRLYAGDTSLDVDPLTDAKPLAWPAASFFRQG